MSASQRFGIVAWTGILLIEALRNSLFNGWFGTSPAWMLWVAAGLLLLNAFHRPARAIFLPKGTKLEKGTQVHVRVTPPQKATRGYHLTINS